MGALVSLRYPDWREETSPRVTTDFHRDSPCVDQPVAKVPGLQLLLRHSACSATKKQTERPNKKTTNALRDAGKEALLLLAPVMKLELALAFPNTSQNFRGLRFFLLGIARTRLPF